MPGRDPRLNQRELKVFSGSTAVERAWYDADHKVLEVLFTSGRHWLYEDVGENLWKAFKVDGSPGRFVRQALSAKINRAK